MKNHQQPACTLTEKGEDQLLRAAMASEFLVNVLQGLSASSSNKLVSTEGIAALVECISLQLDGAVKESSMIKADRHD
ncbi:MAG: hypothetical protein QM578_11100 [Pantoea sp.]|uniref:hypothetical protein n=1 Tax=Pantoea sp. TaxID=69393 RepID=UPI0039E6E42B